MLALAFLSIAAATEHASSPPPDDQIPLTRNEIAALLAALIIDPANGTRHRLRWSDLTGGQPGNEAARSRGGTQPAGLTSWSANMTRPVQG